MHAFVATAWRFLLPAFAVLALAIPTVYAERNGDHAKRAPARKGQDLTVAEFYEKLKAGIFKLTEADVLKVLGRPSGLRQPGDAGSDLQMRWEYATNIFATFKDGKLSEVTGSFSEHLPVVRITVNNFKRLRIGMTEPQVVEMLGQSNSTHKADTTTIAPWGRTAQLRVSFNKKGVIFNPGLQEVNAVSMPMDIQFTVPGPVKR